MAIPFLEARAISSNAPARPPSVGSCIAVTWPVDVAMLAAFTIDIPGESRNSAALEICCFVSPAERSADLLSRAIIAVPSIAIPEVIITSSPKLAADVFTVSDGAASPSMVPAIIGRGSPIVISVCPPISIIPSSVAASWSWANLSLAVEAGSFSGRNSVPRNHFGVPPDAAMSLALT